MKRRDDSINRRIGTHESGFLFFSIFIVMLQHQVADQGSDDAAGGDHRCDREEAIRIGQSLERIRNIGGNPICNPSGEIQNSRKL